MKSNSWAVPGNVSCKCCEDWGKEIRVSFCPKCKSRDVRYVFGLGNLFGIMPKMRCGECGFSNPSFPVLVTNEKLLRASVRKMKSKVQSKKSKVGSRKSKVKSGATGKKTVTPTRQRASVKGKKKIVRRRKK